MKTKPKEKILTYFIGLADLALLVLSLLQIFHPIFKLPNLGVFNAKGSIAQAQSRLIITAILMMLCLAIPVLAAGFFIIFKYRDGRNGEYDPDWGQRHNRLQWVWWLFPGLLIALISIINFQSAHNLDPLKAIDPKTKPLTIEVMALEWKWLFIYPDQDIATVNTLDIPQNVPVQFVISADGPMSLFWIPQLGGQMAAMTGMTNHLNLIATDLGSFRGQNSEINGAGYAGMTFTVNSVTPSNFKTWVAAAKQSSPALTAAVYKQLELPAQNVPAATYAPVDPNLYYGVIDRYMGPPSVGHDHG